MKIFGFEIPKLKKEEPKKEELNKQGPRVGTEVMKAVAEAEKGMSKLPSQEEVKNWGDEEVENFLSSIIGEIEAEDSSVTEILENKLSAVTDRRASLEKDLFSTAKIRIEGVKKGQATIEQAHDGLKGFIKKQIEKYKQEDNKKERRMVA